MRNIGIYSLTRRTSPAFGTRRIRHFAANLPSNTSLPGVFALPKFSRRRFFCLARSSVCHCYERTGRAPCANWVLRLQLPSALICCVLAFICSTREAPAVDLALKLNVLAVCAVFAFVGAILLGAF